MGSSVFGLIAGVIIVIYSIFQTSDDITPYLNFVSVLIVFGGTISAAVITHGIKKIKDIMVMFFKAFKTSKCDNVKIVKDIVDISESLKKGSPITELIDQADHPYVKDGLRLIYNDFSEDKILNISKRMLLERASYYRANIEKLEVLAKYPPAFGMMGTVIGLIAVMRKMGLDTGIELVGPSMAVALITTLYGIFLANYIIHPISDNLASRSERDLKIRRIISEGIILLYKKEEPVFVREMLMAYLLPSEREQFLKDRQVEPTLFQEAA